MKIKLLLSLLLLILLTGSVNTLKGQCGNELFEKCVEKHKEGRFLRSFPVQLEQQIQGETLPVRKYSLVMTSGTKYRISTCNATEFPGMAIVSLHHENELIASSFDIKNQKHLPYLVFECTQSGVYSLSFFFEGGQQGCAVGVITTE